jgi:hypothetical protein
MTEHPEPTLGRPAKYPWDLWIDGQEHFLREGDDFDSTAESFVILVRRTARTRGIPVEVHRMTLKGTGEHPAGNYVLFRFSAVEVDDGPVAQAG